MLYIRKTGPNKLFYIFYYYFGFIVGDIEHLIAFLKIEIYENNCLEITVLGIKAGGKEFDFYFVRCYII